MLFTAHWVVAFPFLLQFKAPVAVSKAQKNLPVPPSLRRAPKAYRPVHLHHPCSKWVQASKANYVWLCDLAIALGKEHDIRWPHNQQHSCAPLAEWLRAHPPALPNLPLTPFAVAMPDEYKAHDPIVSYRRFYRGSKTDRGITSSYTVRHPPHWLKPSTRSNPTEPLNRV